MGRMGLMGLIRPMGLMGPMGPIRLIALIALMGLMGCSSEETTRTAETTSQLRPIAFGDAYTVKPTRSSTTFTGDKGIPVGQSIGVYAYLHNKEGRNYSADIPNFMFNQQCTRRDDADYFAYSPVKYWPNDENSKVSFIAYFPYTVESPGQTDTPHYPDNATGLQTLLSNSDQGLPTFNFTVKDNIDEQVDFMVSDVMANLPKSRDTEDDPGQPFNDLSIQDRVTFLLKHMTAKVEFRIVADPEIHKDIVNFQLTDLNVTNLLTSGKLTPSYDKNSGITSFAWSEQATTHNYDFTTYKPQLLMPHVLHPQTPDDETKAMLNVSYSITFKSDGTTYHYVEGVPVADQEYTYRNSATIQLNEMKMTGTDTPVTEWLPNHHYIYTIRLRANRIEFTGQVVDWGDTHDDIPGIEIKDE